MNFWKLQRKKAPSAAGRREGVGARMLRAVKFIAAFLVVPVLVSLAIFGILRLVEMAARDWLQQSSIGIFLDDQFLFTYAALVIYMIGAWFWGPIAYGLVCIMSPAHPVRIYALFGAVVGFLTLAPIMLPLALLDSDLDLVGRLHAAGTFVQGMLMACAYALALRFSFSLLGLIGAVKPKQA